MGYYFDDQDKFKGRYHIKSQRLQNWDYAAAGFYFVTICTQDKEHYFGEIINHKMQFTEIGRIAEQCWIEIPKHFPFVKLDRYIVMPNHVHGIIIIDKNGQVAGDNGPSHADDTVAIVGAQNFAPLPERPDHESS